MQLTGFLPVARRWWWLLVVSTLVAALAGWAVVSRTAPRYEASVQLLVGPINTDLDTQRASSQLAQTYAQLATSADLLARTGSQVGTRLAAGDVSASANDVTRYVTIRVQSGSAQVSAAAANKLAANLIALAGGGTARPWGQLQVVNAATPPTRAILPRASLLAGLAGLAGLLGSLALVLVFEYLRDTVKSGPELARLAGTSLLGSIQGPARGEGPLAVEASPASLAATSYQVLATEIEYLGAGAPLRSLLVLGAQAGDGAGEVAANLASALARSGRRVALLDANPAEAEITTLLGLRGRLGLAELLRHGEVLEGPPQTLRRFQLPGSGLLVLPAGSADGLGVVDAQRVGRLLEQLLVESDLVVVNAAPVHASSSGLVWARSTDATVLVASRDRTKQERISHTAESLRLVGANLIGTVLNRPRGRLAELRRGRGAPEPALWPMLATSAPPAGPADGTRSKPGPRSETTETAPRRSARTERLDRP